MDGAQCKEGRLKKIKSMYQATTGGVFDLNSYLFQYFYVANQIPIDLGLSNTIFKENT